MSIFSWLPGPAALPGAGDVYQRRSEQTKK